MQTQTNHEKYQAICRHKWHAPYINEKEFRCSLCDKSITTQAEARQYAIDWQNWAGEARTENMSYSELSEWQSEFYDLAIKFDLTEEFKENGII